MNFCKVCGYHMFIQATEDKLTRQCRHCGIKEELNPKTAAEALILETHFRTEKKGKQQQSAMNEFTRTDPTIPHLHNVKCPNDACPSNGDTNPPNRDVIYIKTDTKNLLYQYQCIVCSRQWST